MPDGNVADISRAKTLANPSSGEPPLQYNYKKQRWEYHAGFPWLRFLLTFLLMVVFALAGFYSSKRPVPKDKLAIIPVDTGKYGPYRFEYEGN